MHFSCYARRIMFNFQKITTQPPPAQSYTGCLRQLKADYAKGGTDGLFPVMTDWNPNCDIQLGLKPKKPKTNQNPADGGTKS